MQGTILFISLLLIGLVAVVFAAVVLASTTRGEPDKKAIEKHRIRLMAAFAVVGLVITYVSLRPWPHEAEASEGAVTVEVTASQWSWEISKKEIPTATSVVFNVQSQDVNHGVGVYDPKGVLLFQTQAMPGVVNRVKYTFAEPGSYRVLCMEYCGLAHHGMIDEFKVVEK